MRTNRELAFPLDYQVPGAEGLVIRVLSSVDKKLKVQPEFWEFFKNRNYPSEFPYKSKVLTSHCRKTNAENLFFFFHFVIILALS